MIRDRNIFYKSLIALVFSIFVLNSFSQKKGKEFYLIDSVNTDKLSKFDKGILDSLLTIYHNTSVDTVRVFMIRLISENLFDQNLWPKYNRLFFGMLEGKTDRFSNIQRAYAYNNFGYEYQYIKNDLFNAKKNYYDSYRIFEKYNDFNGLGAEVNNLGFIYQYEGNIGEAIRLYSKALSIFEKNNNAKGLATEYLNLGDIYLKNEDWEKAEQYFRNALVYVKRSTGESFSSSNVEANIYNELGVINANKGKHGEAMSFYKKAWVIYDTLGDLGKLSLITGNIADELLLAGKYKEAEEKFMEAKTYALKIKDNQTLSRIYNKLSDFYLGKEDIKSSKKYADSSYYFSKQIGYPELILNSTKRLAKLYELQGDSKKAYELLAEAFVMRDSIYNDNTRKAAIKQQFKTEYEVKEIQLKAEDDKKDQQRKLEKKREQIIIYVVVFALICMTIVAYVVYRNFRSKKRSAAILEEKNRIISEQKKVVEEKQKEVLDSIHYAKRIQQSLLASEKYIHRNIGRLKGDKENT